jgi:hypothetical protein
MWTAVLYTEDSAVPYYLDVKPFMKYGKTYVPVRDVLDRLGAEIQWNPAEETVYLAANVNRVVLKPGEESAVAREGRENGHTTGDKGRADTAAPPVRGRKPGIQG